MPYDAIILMDPAGRYIDANLAALDILGVTLDQLVAAPPGAFSSQPDDPEASVAFRDAWEGQGKPDITGEATITRPDGGQRRVAFRIVPAEEGFVAQLRMVEGSTAQPSKVATVGDVLAAWREAERRMDTILEGSPEWTAIQADVARWRDEYHHAFDSLTGRHGTP